MSVPTPVVQDQNPGIDVRVVKYCVVSGTDDMNFEEMVESKSIMGWKLQGGVAVTVSQFGNLSYHQAMWREADYEEVMYGTN